MSRKSVGILLFQDIEVLDFCGDGQTYGIPFSGKPGTSNRSDLMDRNLQAGCSLEFIHLQWLE
jgi:hypothetical protein